jgi:hypothetical protein
VFWPDDGGHCEGLARNGLSRGSGDFCKATDMAKAALPVSKLLKAQITLDATLVN